MTIADTDRQRLLAIFEGAQREDFGDIIEWAYGRENPDLSAYATLALLADQYATQDTLNALSSVFFGAIPYATDDAVSAGDQRIYNGSIFEATEDIPAGCPPLGIGDGSLLDRLLLLSRVKGFATGTTGGGVDGTLVTVTNDHDTGAGSLRQALIDHQTAKTSDPTRKTWIIFSKSYNTDGDGVAVYNITPASVTFIAGKGSADITIDGRGVDLTYNGGGSPGGVGIGSHPFPFGLGGANNYSESFGDGNATPTNNIIITGMKFPYNAGGEDGDNGFWDVFDRVLWANHIYIEHCEFTNHDWETDGNLETGYGATMIHDSWCVIGPHDKSEIIIDNFPPGHSLPPGVSLAAPGPFELWTDATTPDGRVVMYVSQDHCYKPHVGDRAPYVKGNAARYHGWNIWSDQDGFYALNILLPPSTGGYIYYGTDPTFGGNAVNIGGPFQCGKGAHMRLDGCIVTPYSNTLAGSTGATRGVFSKREGIFGFSKTTDMLYEGSKRNDGGDHFPNSVFVPPYGFVADSPGAGLKARLLAYAGAKTRLWKYIGPGVLSSAMNVQSEGADIGSGVTPIAAKTINFEGTAFSSVTFDGVDTVTVTADAGDTDPTNFLLVGTALPAAGITYLGKRFRVVTHYTSGVPDDGVEYECRFNATAAAYQWERVANVPVVDAPPGRLLTYAKYRPTSAQSTATTTSTTSVDITIAGIAASWTGLVAASLDLTFLIPTSRKVIIDVEAFVAQGSAGAKVYFGLYDITNSAILTNLVNQVMAVTNGSRVRSRFALDSTVLGTAGTSLTIRPQWYVSANTGSIFAGGTFGAVSASAEIGV